MCHMQTCSNDTAIMGCVWDAQDGEYRGLVEDFIFWCQSNQLQLNTSKTKDYLKSGPLLLPGSVEGATLFYRTYVYR